MIARSQSGVTYNHKLLLQVHQMPIRQLLCQWKVPKVLWWRPWKINSVRYKVYCMESNERVSSNSASSLILIIKKKYDESVLASKNYEAGNKKDEFMKNANNRFSLGRHLQDNNLYMENVCEDSRWRYQSYRSFFEEIHWHKLFRCHSWNALISISFGVLKGPWSMYQVCINKHRWGLPKKTIKVCISLSQNAFNKK